MSDNLTRDEAFARSAHLSNVAYDVALDLTGVAETYLSSTRVTFDCSQPGMSTFIDLEAEGVGSARLNGVDLPAEAFTGVRLHLEDLQETNELVVEADCRYKHTGVGLHRFVDPVDDAVYLYTQFESFEAHRVYACFDQPDLKATFRLTVEAPAQWVVVSNGEVISQPGEGQAGTWEFATTKKMSTYITAIVAGPYKFVTDRHGDIDLGIYCRASLLEHLDADEIFEITKQGFDFFTAEFGYPYPFGKYDQLFVPEFNAGAMENAGCVTFSELYIFRSKVTQASRRRRAETILHEMAHMWFGDLVTMRWWDDLWLNESFATYMAYRALVGATRFTDSWSDFATDLKGWAYNQDQLPSTHPIVADIVDTDAVRNNFDGITYAKGASVLRQLAAWVGDEAFIKGLQTYFPRHEYANAELKDFLAALEESSGRPLGPWAAQWLQTTGVTTMRPELEISDGAYTAVAVTQEAPEEHPTLRTHRVGMGLYDLTDDGLALRRRVEPEIDGARTEIPELVGEAAADLFLPNDGDLAYTKIRLAPRSIETLSAHMGRLLDPLARALCWAALWDMTRDAELPARRYVHLVVEQARNESDIGVLGMLLARVHMAVERLGSPENRNTLREFVAARAWELVDEAEPGSDAQLVWARSFATHAQTQDQLATVRQLLDGETTVKGLAIDTDLRWHLVNSLAVKGAGDEALIAAELERDPTDQGRRRAATARAARPDQAAKAAAFDALVNDRRMPLATKRATLAGFHQYGQEELLRPFGERFVEALPTIWDGRSAEESLELTEGLYPSVLVEDDTLALADRALQLDAVPEPGKRLIVEARDATGRAQRARAADAAGAERA